MGQNLQKESWILKDFLRIFKKCDKFGDLRFEKLAFKQRICKRTKEMLRKLQQFCYSDKGWVKSVSLYQIIYIL